LSFSQLKNIEKVFLILKNNFMDISELESKGIPRNIAEFLLEKFKNNPDKLYMFLNSLQKEIVVLKMKISFSIYSGIVIVFLNRRSGTIDFVKTYFSTDPEIAKQNIEISWRDLVSKIAENYPNFRIDEEISSRVQKLIYSDDNFRNTLLKLTEENKTPIDIRRFLYTYMPVMFGDERTVVRFSYERTDVFDFYNFLKNSNIEIPKTLKFIELGKFEYNDEEPKGIYEFEVQPVLAPIDGVTVENIKQGDTVYVSLEPGQSTSEIFSTSNEEKARILFAKKLDFGRYLVYTELGPGFIGKFVVKEDVKIKVEKTADSQQDIGVEKITPNVTLEQPKVEEKLEITSEDANKVGNNIIFWVINIAIIVIGIAVVMILLLFM